MLDASGHVLNTASARAAHAIARRRTRPDGLSSPEDMLDSAQFTVKSSAPSLMSRLTRAGAVPFVAGAAWLSQGIVAFTGGGADRIAVLPASAWALSIVALAAAAGLVAVRRKMPLAPFVLLAPLFLPWGRAPALPAFQMWQGGMALLLWIVAGLALASAAPWRLPAVGRPRLAAGLLACSIFGVAAWQVAPSVPAGDEPHYLVITQSLLKDGDLRIENNHRDGGYRAYFPGTLRPDFLRRGQDGQIYSIHAPGVSALVAPAFALGGYPAVVGFLILCASAGSVLAWHAAWMATRRAGAAWFGWAAVTLSATAIFHSFTVYPDLPGAVLALTGVWALLRAREERETGRDRVLPWLLHGAALAALPWMHTRFALLAGSLGALVLLRLAATPRAAAKAVAFLSVPAVSALGWVGYFIAIYGTPDPSAPYGVRPDSGALAFIPGGLAGLLFDQRFGLLAYAPVLVFAAGGFVVMLRQRADRRLALELLFIVVPYLLVVTRFAMWWGGHSAPARFFMPVLLMMSIPAAAAWTAIRSRATRATAWAALVLTVFASGVLVFVDGGRLAYNTRDAYAAWLDWLTTAVHLGSGLPAFWRGREHELFRDAAIWILVLTGGWALLRVAERNPSLGGRAVFATAAAAIYGAAGMTAATILWVVSSAQATTVTPAQLEVLRRVGAGSHLVAFDPRKFRRIAAAAVPPMLRIEPERPSAPGGAGRDDRPLFVLPGIPAGQYRLQPGGAGGGWLTVGIGRDQFALRTVQAASPPAPIVIDLPIAVRGIIVRGDEQARRSISTLVVTALSVVPAGARLSEDAAARRAVRYDGGTVFFLDDRSFPEPEAFWVGGATQSRVVLQPDRPGAPASILLRNAPVENRVVLQSGRWREELRLAPGEERRVDVPIDPRRRAALLELSSSSGFRLSDVEPESQDERFLGVWVRVLNR